MAFPIRSPKDFWAGALYAALGAAAVVVARDYGMGSSSRMGAGYFPTVLGGLLVAVGLASLVRSFFVRGEPIGAIAWKGMALVTVATVLFGLLLRPAGLVPALVALLLVSAAASHRFRLEWRALALMAALVAFCALVFVKGLGLPVTLFGTWLGG
ncbi:MAG: tripartite tricarboxylate transporter TctB family protein [Burkholderiales bacterium]